MEKRTAGVGKQKPAMKSFEESGDVFCFRFGGGPNSRFSEFFFGNVFGIVIGSGCSKCHAMVCFVLKIGDPVFFLRMREGILRFGIEMNFVFDCDGIALN